MFFCIIGLQAGAVPSKASSTTCTHVQREHGRHNPDSKPNRKGKVNVSGGQLARQESSRTVSAHLNVIIGSFCTLQTSIHVKDTVCLHCWDSGTVQACISPLLPCGQLVLTVNYFDNLWLVRFCKIQGQFGCRLCHGENFLELSTVAVQDVPVSKSKSRFLRRQLAHNAHYIPSCCWQNHLRFHNPALFLVHACFSGCVL